MNKLEMTEYRCPELPEKLPLSYELPGLCGNCGRIRQVKIPWGEKLSHQKCFYCGAMQLVGYSRSTRFICVALFCLWGAAAVFYLGYVCGGVKPGL